MEINSQYTNHSSEEKYNVLVVDDIHLMCQFLFNSIILLPSTSCKMATDVPVAENILNQESIDMAVLDLHLKTGSGLSLVQKIRQGKCKNTAYDIPIVIFSGNTYKELVQECLRYNVNDFLVKPITSVIIQSKVKYYQQIKTKPIKPKEHYQNLVEQNTLNLQSLNPKASITKSTQQKSSYKPSSSAPAKQDEGEAENGAFLHWIGGVTTGYNQLDRRLKSLCFELNELHSYFHARGKETETKIRLKKIREIIEDTVFVAKNLRARNMEEPIWTEFFDKMRNFQRIKWAALINAKPGSNSSEEVFKGILFSWMMLIAKPIFSQVKK
jgi:response regulator of citrate/malate metabolism